MTFAHPRLAGRFSRGFTLIEIMVVVVILGILATLVVPRIMERPDQARVIKAKQDLQAIKSALDLYKLDNFDYPQGDLGLQALVSPPDSGSGVGATRYLDKLPVDPWGNPYEYLNPGVKGDVDIFSYGADGQPGGEGVRADIGNWDQ